MFSVRSEGGCREEGKGQHMLSPHVQRGKEIIQNIEVDPSLLKNRREMFRNLKWLMVEIVKQMTHLPECPIMHGQWAATLSVPWASQL